MAEFLLLTSRVDVEVSGLVSHVPCSLQAGSSGVHLAGVAHVLRYVHCVRTLVDVLTGKQHFDLGGQTGVGRAKMLSNLSVSLHGRIHFFRKKESTHLVNALDFGNVGDGVGSFFVFPGFDLCLKGHIITNGARIKKKDSAG